MHAKDILSKPSLRTNKYTKVRDARKHEIRGVWERNGRFYARLSIEDDLGQKAVKWVPLTQGPNHEPVRTPARANLQGKSATATPTGQ